MEKKYRLRSNIQFKKVYRSGKSYGNRLIVLFVFKNGLKYNRVGYAVTKKVGNSVTRNRVRRRMKEIYRLNSFKIKKGYDLIFLPRINSKDSSYRNIESAMFHLLKIAHILNE